MNRNHSKHVRGNPRFTPLMMSSFSRLHESSLNQTADSGYQSSFASLSSSFTPSSDSTDSASRLYCSTPVTQDSVLSHKTTFLDPVLDTPVHIPANKKRFSEDRIPRQKITLPIDEESTNFSSDVLSSLIRHCVLATQRVFHYTNAEDLLRLCQVSDIYCRAVCDDQAALKRLSKYLISVHQNGENRATHSNVGGRPYGGILRPIDNLLSFNVPPGHVWSVPSPLEAIDLNSVPCLLRRLVEMTKTLSENQVVSICHSCRTLVPVRITHHRLTECSSCSQRSRRQNANRSATRTKVSLLPSFRWTQWRIVHNFSAVYSVLLFFSSCSCLSFRFFCFIRVHSVLPAYRECVALPGFFNNKKYSFVYWFFQQKKTISLLYQILFRFGAKCQSLILSVMKKNLFSLFNSMLNRWCSYVARN